jgi:hypothetical protein
VQVYERTRLTHRVAELHERCNTAIDDPLTPAVVLEAQARYEAYADETEFMRASHNAHVGQAATASLRACSARSSSSAATGGRVVKPLRAG